jgi:hypothetical protein
LALTKRQSEWLLTGGVWLAAVPGFLGWSWWNVLWLAIPVGAIFLYPKPRRIRLGLGGRHDLALGVALTILAPLLIAAILFGIGRMAASSFGI